MRRIIGSILAATSLTLIASLNGQQTLSERAAEYVAAHFEKAGLEPAGIGGYIQPVKLKTRRIVEAQSSLSLVRDGKTDPLSFQDDANISMRIDPAPSVDAPLVFVGYGVKIPEQNIDDFHGLNSKGAVVVHISATPRSLPGPLQAHFGSNAERWKMYKAEGAIGTISIANPKSMDIPWARSTLSARSRRWRWPIDRSTKPRDNNFP